MKNCQGPPNEIYDKNFYTKRMFCHVAIHCPRVATVRSVSTVRLCTQLFTFPFPYTPS